MQESLRDQLARAERRLARLDDIERDLPTGSGGADELLQLKLDLRAQVDALRRDIDRSGATGTASTTGPQSVRLCTDPTCSFRFPAPADAARFDECPMCGTSTRVVATVATHAPPDSAPPTRAVVALLDNVRSALNVGTIVRTADGARVSHLHLCGITPTPENPKVAKTSLGAEQTVGWTHHRNAVDAVATVRSAGFEIWALEAAPTSTGLFVASTASPPGPRVALIVGNEIAGVDPELIRLADRVVHLPMHGAKTSLNVGVAFGIAAYWLRSLG